MRVVLQLRAFLIAKGLKKVEQRISRCSVYLKDSPPEEEPPLVNPNPVILDSYQVVELY
jgi:hypothetical protein